MLQPPAIAIATFATAVAASNIAVAILDNILLRSHIGMARFYRKNEDFHHQTRLT